MASAAVSAPLSRRPLEPIVAVVAVVSLALWPVEIHRAFGLPAHPLLIHVPVIFIPILGLIAIGLAIFPRERWNLPVAAFSVVTLAATLLAVGAGEAFREDRERGFGGGFVDPTLQDHAEAGETLRWLMVALTAVLVVTLFRRRLPVVFSIVLRVLSVLLAAAAIFFVIRTGHLGAKLAWGREGGGGPPAGFQGGGFPPGGSRADTRARRRLTNAGPILDTVKCWPKHVTSKPSASSTASTRPGWGSPAARYLGTNHPLAEARVLFELGAGRNETRELRTALDIDAGQLSRLLTKLERDGLLQREREGRTQRVKLTRAGIDAFETLNERSSAEIGQILDALPDARPALDAMAAMRRTFAPENRVHIRGPEPGDLGWLVARHGVLYAREYGWDESFERMVAQIAADFDPATDRAWIAEVDGQRAGAVLCVHHDDTTAKLRTLLVEPSARGLGLGTRLVTEVITHAAQRGYTTLTLWTNDVLHSARHIYERLGFQLQSESPHHAFGHDLTEQTWSLTLHPWTETR